MGKAIGEILPFALGAAISVIPIIAIILMLVTPKAKANGTSFAAGFVAWDEPAIGETPRAAVIDPAAA